MLYIIHCQIIVSFRLIIDNFLLKKKLMSLAQNALKQNSGYKRIEILNHMQQKCILFCKA